jgi:hypothetical protein
MVNFAHPGKVNVHASCSRALRPLEYDQYNFHAFLGKWRAGSEVNCERRRKPASMFFPSGSSTMQRSDLAAQTWQVVSGSACPRGGEAAYDVSD